jgi:type II secretory pathway predicted ATPase ExeA
LITQTGKALLAEREEGGRTPVLVLVEAHLLTYEQLQTIRVLTNQGMDQDSPLACLLVGQPTLRRTMKLAVLAALEQRTALRYTMPGMTATETGSYIAHHIKLVGRPDQLFTEGALNLIHSTARGHPRAVNNLSLQALVAAFAAGKNLVDEPAARAAVSEVVD